MAGVAVAGGTGCGDAAAPSALRAEAVPSVYREWFAATEACSGLQGDFARLRFFIVEGASFPCSSGRCAGRWEHPDRIVLASDWARHEMVVRHEMLHALLGRPGHPDPPFEAGCNLTWNSWRDPVRVVLGTAPHGDELPVVE